MGSTKTLNLLTTAYNFEERDISFICIKPSTDTREGEGIIKSRVGIERQCETAYPETDVYELIKNRNSALLENRYRKIEWVLADEAQFFSEQQIEQLAKAVDVFDINIICYGLRTDFRSRLFPGSRRLFELADNIEEVKASCSCGRKTSINARIDERGNVVTSGEQVLIGGNDKYIAMCRKCWHKRIVESKSPKLF
jgi:thymidine kinase